MITKGTKLEQADMIEAYCVKNNVACLYLDLRGYNALATDKKATVTTYYDTIEGRKIYKVDNYLKKQYSEYDKQQERAGSNT